MSHEDESCTCDPGCTCDAPFEPWDEEGSCTGHEDGTVTTTQSTNGRWRMLSAELDESGLFLTIHWEPVA